MIFLAFALFHPLTLAVDEVRPPHAAVVIRHEITSEFQGKSLPLSVLLPDAVHGSIPGSQRLPVVYVLPVEATGEYRWGHPVEECLKLDLHNRCQVILAFPEFSDLPWYADHPTNPRLQQESFLLKAVIPFVDSNYPTDSSRKGRLLTGFSKSGWGALSLMLRHPDTFEAAAVFDAPLMMSQPGPYGSGPIFGDDDHFRQYQVSKLITQSALNSSQMPPGGRVPRLALLGGGNFQREHNDFEELLRNNSIPTVILSNEKREHSWHSGWLLPAVDWLRQHYSTVKTR